jgi:hypothetical protein
MTARTEVHADGTTGARPPRWAPIADAGVLVVFVAIGRRSHGLEETGITWFLTVLWPIALAWVVGALALSLYRARTREFVRLLGTIVTAVVVGGLLRYFTPGRAMFSAFTVVLACGLSLGTYGWRVGWRVARR